MPSHHHPVPLRRDERDLQKRLLKYSAAASLALAASVALPAATGRTDPGIRCVDVDPDQTVSGGWFDIDFDQDFNAEFRLSQSFSGVFLTNLSNGGDRGTGAMTGAPFYPAALPTSESVSAGAPNWSYTSNGTLAMHAGSVPYGFWGGATDRYLGLRFTLQESGTHYGWALLDVAPDASSFTIKKYCYNDFPGDPIHTSDPPAAVTLSGLEASSGSPSQLLAVGAALLATLTGLAAWGRQRVAKRLDRRAG